MEEPLMRLLDIFESVSPEAFGWMVQQAIIKGYIMAVWGLGLGLVWASIGSWAARMAVVKDTYDADDYIILSCFMLLFFGLSVGLATYGMYHIFTPEAHALRSVLHLAR